MASAVHKKQSESKYVTCFADSRPDVDVTFRDVLLGRPTDHYLVGIDNFSMTNTSLSMIEPMTGDAKALIRIVKRLAPTAGDVDVIPNTRLLDDQFVDVPRNLSDLYVTGDYNGETYALEILSSEVILSVQQLLHRLNELAGDVNRFMNSGHATNSDATGNYEYGGYTPKADGSEDTEHLKFEVATDGRLQIIGTKAFWSCFCIEIPSVMNQFGFYGNMPKDNVPPTDFTNQRRFLALNPHTGDPTFTKIQVNTELLSDDTTVYDNPAAIAAHNSRTVKGTNPKYYMRSDPIGATDIAKFNIYTGQDHNTLYAYTMQACIFSSMERRISLEVGCSLPIKNSPMVDHQKETPDFVIGRWIWRTDPRIESNQKGGTRRYHSAMPACTEYQGATDRITYHELQPQAKIQTLRIKLFARLRTFDESTRTYGMRIIELPTSITDWWHVRLHFMSKD